MVRKARACYGWTTVKGLAKKTPFQVVKADLAGCSPSNEQRNFVEMRRISKCDNALTRIGAGGRGSSLAQYYYRNNCVFQGPDFMRVEPVVIQGRKRRASFVIDEPVARRTRLAMAASMKRGREDDDYDVGPARRGRY